MAAPIDELHFDV